VPEKAEDPRVSPQKIITIEKILEHVKLEVENPSTEKVTQKRFDQYQKMLQELLYEQIDNLEINIKEMKRLNMTYADKM
jgi:hypothetical protein